MYEEDLAVNNLQQLLCHKMKSRVRYEVKFKQITTSLNVIYIYIYIYIVYIYIYIYIYTRGSLNE